MKKSFLLLAVLALVSCSEPAKKVARLSETIPNMPVPPNAELLSREGSEDALLIRFRSPLDPDQITSYYRDVLSKAPWRLVSDTKDADGGVNLYAEQDGPPLWITIRKAVGAEGTLIDLAGAKTRKQ